jgi:hypothetical protein
MHITMTVGADHVEQKRPKEGHEESQEVVENNEGHDKKGENRNSKVRVLTNLFSGKCNVQ